MPGTKEIRVKIRSVQNTRKITKAMEMVAAPHMRKAPERMRATRPYGEKIRNVAAHISHANPEYRHPFVVSRDTVKRVGLIMISTDKGLCGPLNTNAFKSGVALMKDKGQPFEMYTIGRRASMFVRRISGDIKGIADNIPDTPELKDILGVVTLGMERYLEDWVREIQAGELLLGGIVIRARRARERREMRGAAHQYDVAHRKRKVPGVHLRHVGDAPGDLVRQGEAGHGVGRVADRARVGRRDALAGERW